MTNEGEIDFIAVIEVLWRRKVAVCAITATCVIGAVIYALTATPIYRAEVVITEAAELGANGASSSLMNSLGGLASIAGVNLGTGKATAEYDAVLVSRQLAEQFVRQYGLTNVMLANSKQAPSLWAAVERFREGVLKIREDRIKNTKTVSIEWHNAQDAARWANDYVALANSVIRQRAIDDSTRSITYLNEQIAKTSVVELRSVLYKLVESETKTLMLANGRAEYAFTTVDRATPPELRARPKRTMITLIAGFLGLLFASTVVFIYDRISGRRANPRE